MNPEQPQRRATGARPSATRERLLRAARDVVASRGVAGATSREITRAAKANLASITYHFGSKDELVATALTDEIERLLEPALEALASDGDPGSRLITATQLLLDAFAREQERAPAYLEAVLAAIRDGGGAARALSARLQQRLAAVVAEVQADGAIPTWVDAEAMAALIVAAAQGIAMQSLLDPDGPTAEQQASQLAALLLSARR